MICREPNIISDRPTREQTNQRWFCQTVGRAEAAPQAESVDSQADDHVIMPSCAYPCSANDGCRWILELDERRKARCPKGEAVPRDGARS